MRATYRAKPHAATVAAAIPSPAGRATRFALRAKEPAAVKADALARSFKIRHKVFGQGGNEVSVGMVFKNPEGLVLAADSRVTLRYNVPGTQILSQAYYDNATKLLKVTGQDFVGVIAVGLAVLGAATPRTVSSFLPEFEKELGNNQGRMKTSDFASKFGQFFLRQYQALMPSAGAFEPMVFFVAGYDESEAYGRIYRLVIPSEPTPTEIKANEFGIQWEGQTEIIARIVNGYDVPLLSAIQNRMHASTSEFTQLANDMSAASSIKIPYQFIPLQDAADLCILLVETATQLMKYTTDVRGVGGPVDVATVTRVDGFRWVQHKELHGERIAQ
jgi:hypothetical protein